MVPYWFSIALAYACVTWGSIQRPCLAKYWFLQSLPRFLARPYAYRRVILRVLDAGSSLITLTQRYVPSQQTQDAVYRDCIPNGLETCYGRSWVNWCTRERSGAERNWDQSINTHIPTINENYWCDKNWLVVVRAVSGWIIAYATYNIRFLQALGTHIFQSHLWREPLPLRPPPALNTVKTVAVTARDTCWPWP
jgi:hypothetical protein